MTSLFMRHQRGRTLIELMVAIALGLLILLGVGSLYSASNQSTRAATTGASADNVGQVALTLIGNSIRRSGYSEIIGTELLGLAGNVLYAGPNLRGCTEKAFNSNPATGCASTAQAGRDSLAIWFQADNALSAAQGATDDCIGTTPAATTPVTNANYQPRVANVRVVRNVFFIDNNGNLSCSGVAGQPQPLLTGVESMKVYFGFDDVAYASPAVLGVNPTARSIRDADFINSQPAPAADLTAWDFVVSVTVCVLVRTEEQGVSAQASTAGTTLCPANANQAAGTENVATLASSDARAADGRIRRAYTQTFSVRTRGRPSPLAG